MSDGGIMPELVYIVVIIFCAVFGNLVGSWLVIKHFERKDAKEEAKRHIPWGW